MAYHSYHQSMAGSSTQPVFYRPPSEYRQEQHAYHPYEEGDEEEEEEEEQHQEQNRLHEDSMRRPNPSFSQSNLMPAPIDSSRAIANGGLHASNLPPETPSAYSDPYEYNSTTLGDQANICMTRPDQGYMAYDPYTKPPQGSADLERSNTLAPGDSISAYNVDAVARNLNDMQHDHHREQSRYSAYSYYNGRGDESHDYPLDDRGHYRNDSSADDTPLRKYQGNMGYADDEYHEQQQRQREMYWNDYSLGEGEKHPPSLFANHSPGEGPLPIHGMEKGEMMALYKKKKPMPGWGGTLEEQIARRRKGVGRQRWPVLTWIFAIAYVVVFIIELIQAKQKTGQAIQTRPSWNPMLGPSFEFLISFGARFVPCMRKVPDIPTTTQMACLQYSTLSTVTSNELCPIWQICGLADANTTNQTYRFVTSLFIHAGFIHILFNLMVQLTLCAQIEILISSPFYALVYVAGGIGGNLLGANFGLVGQPSVGASGAIYTCISVELIDLCYNWKFEYRPRTRLIVSICFAIVGFAIGLLPGLDNFAHIGGFAVGTLGGLLFCPAIHATKRHRIITWILRLISAALLVGFVIGLSINFVQSDPTETCKWCRYLSCLPTFSQCKGNGLTTTSSLSSR